MSKFAQQITAFNKMYGLPVNSVPMLLGIQRLHDFKHALQNELNEIDAIIGQYEHASSTQHGSAALEEHIGDEQRFSILTNLADLLGDLQVYCASEMAKWGIPLDGTLDIIMASNMSKLGADGKPIVDERGKVQKGPNYWKPEPKIAAMLLDTGSQLEIPPHQRRVYEEKAELTERIEKLRAFLTTDAFANLPREEQVRLHHQYEHMAGYENVLAHRIHFFGNGG